MIDDIFVMYENNGKLFNSYTKAYYNSKHSISKKIWYIFTPTGKKCAKVGDLVKAYKDYFGCDYYDYKNKCSYEQLSLIKEI